jgi:surface protein
LGTTADKLNKLLETKANIKQALIDKGVDIPDDSKFADYPSKIADIASGDDPLGPFYKQLTNYGTNYYYLFAYKTISDPSLIESLDTSNVTNMSNVFSNFSTSSSLDLSGWNVSKITSMYNMFNLATIPELDVTGWDTSKVTNMNGMFETFKGSTITGLNTWNTGKVTNMSSMFEDCKATSLNISNWDVSKVTTMNGMFAGCTNLTTLDISGWDTSNVKEFGSIYWFLTGSSSALLTTVIGELDLSSCTTGMYYSTSYYCFKSLPKLETLYLKNIYKNSTMTNAVKWSINLGSTKVKDECLVYIINELPDLISDKGLTSTDKIVLTLPPTNTLTAEQVQVAIDKGWNVANTTY